MDHMRSMINGKYYFRESVIITHQVSLITKVGWKKNIICPYLCAFNPTFLSEQTRDYLENYKLIVANIFEYAKKIKFATAYVGSIQLSFQSKRETILKTTYTYMQMYVNTCEHAKKFKFAHAQSG